MDGSGVRWKMMFGLVGASMRRAALQAVSPVSLTALHVYRPLSVLRRSEYNDQNLGYIDLVTIYVGLIHFTHVRLYSS